MPSFVAFALAAAGIHTAAEGNSPKFVVPDVRDLTIETRETIDLPQSTVQTNVLYFKGAWQRRELTCSFRRPWRTRERCGMARSPGVTSDVPSN